MTDALMSPSTFKWFLTFLVVALTGPVLLWDLSNLVKLRGADFTDPEIRDRRFGYVVGMVICTIGLYGCLRFHGVV